MAVRVVKKQVLVRVPEALYQTIEALAQRERRTPSGMAALLIEDAMAERGLWSIEKQAMLSCPRFDT